MSTKTQQQTPVVTAAHAAFSTTESRPLLLTVEQFPVRNPAFTQSALRNLIFRAVPRQSSKGEISGNGLIEAGAVIRLGRRVLINEAKFLAWVAKSGTASIAPNSGVTT